MAVDYDRVEMVLQYRAKDPQLKLTFNHLNQYLKKDFPDLKDIVNILVDHGLFETRESGVYSQYVMITALGEKVSRNGGFKKFKEDLDAANEREAEKDRLEMHHLRQNVRINKYQFWIMMIGAIGGFVSFAILVYQFISV